MICPVCKKKWHDLARHLLFVHGEKVVLWLP
jgi:hypothetical protein